DLDVEALEDTAQMRLGGRCVLVGSEAVVDLDLAQIRDDVAGDATGDAHGAHALAVREPLDVHLFGAVLGEAAEDRCGRVDRVLADPRPRAVRAYAMGADDR